MTEIAPVDSVRVAQAILCLVKSGSSLLLNPDLRCLMEADMDIRDQLENLEFCVSLGFQIIQPILQNSNVSSADSTEVQFSALGVAKLFNITGEQALEVLENI